MRFLKQSSTAQPLMFLLVQSADHITPLTGATPTVTLSKNGNGFNAPSGAVSEVANGWYKVAGNATDTDTLGPLILHATAASGDPTDVYFDVVAVNPQSANAFITGINSLAPPTDWNLTSIDAFGRLDISKIAGTTQTARDLGASVLLSSGTGTGQVLLSSGTVTLADGSLTTAKLGTFALAKTTNITGFNDIAATDIVSGGAITTNDGIANANTIQIYDSDQAADGAFRAFAYYMDNSFTLPMVASVAGNVGGNVIGSIGSLATQAKADVNAEADTALADYDPPTNAEMVARTLAAASYATAANQTAMQGATFDTATDSLEAIRNRGDAAWITATGFSTLDAAGIRTAIGLASANLDTQLSAIVADTNELQLDWVNGGRLDLLIDGIKARTDNLPDAAIIHTAGRLHVLDGSGNSVANETGQNEIQDVTNKLETMLVEVVGHDDFYQWTEEALELGNVNVELDSDDIEQIADGVADQINTTGNGDWPVNHDSSGDDAMRILETDTSDPIDDATITALVEGAKVAQTRTGSDGRWVADLMLDAGDYTINVSKANEFEAYSFTITVEDDGTVTL